MVRRPVEVPPARITGDRATHATYGVGPATDYACDVGTPVVAPIDGYLWLYGDYDDDGGLGIVIDGDEVQFFAQHMSARMAGEGRRYAEGTTTALSGNTGALTSGPHVHCYVIVKATGERLTFEEWLARPSGGDGEEWDMTTLDELLANQNRIIKSNARIEAALGRLEGRGTGRFFKHGGKNVTLWIYLLENGDFVRIRKLATAKLYREQNGGIASTVLSPAAINELVDDLVSSGGRDLSALDVASGATYAVTVPTTEAQKVADSLIGDGY